MAIEDFVLEFVLFDDPWGKEGKRNSHIFKAIKQRRQVIFFISRHIYFAPGVLSTLFHRSFAVVMSDVCVVSLPG